MKSEESPRLITLGREAMISPGWAEEDPDTPCREVRVLTGGKEPPPDASERKCNGGVKCEKTPLGGSKSY